MLSRAKQKKNTPITSQVIRLLQRVNKTSPFIVTFGNSLTISVFHTITPTRQEAIHKQRNETLAKQFHNLLQP